jgi:hypothetical protein
MQTPLSPFGDGVAPFSAARHSVITATKAMVTPAAFGCGCAALSFIPVTFTGCLIRKLVINAQTQYHACAKNI